MRPAAEIFFLIMDGEREEILPFLDRLGGGDGAQHDGFAERRDAPRRRPGGQRGPFRA